MSLASIATARPMSGYCSRREAASASKQPASTSRSARSFRASGSRPNARERHQERLWTVGPDDVAEGDRIFASPRRVRQRQQASFDRICRRLLQRDRQVPVALVVFDVLELDGEPTMRLAYRHRARAAPRARLRRPVPALPALRGRALWRRSGSSGSKVWPRRGSASRTGPASGRESKEEPGVGAV